MEVNNIYCLQFTVTGNLVSLSLLSRDTNNIPSMLLSHNSHLDLVQLVNNLSSYFSMTSTHEIKVSIVMIEASRPSLQSEAQSNLGSAWLQLSPTYFFGSVLDVLVGAVNTAGKISTRGLTPEKVLKWGFGSVKKTAHLI